AAAARLSGRCGRGRGAVSFLGGAEPLALGRLRRPRLLHARTPAHPGPRAVPVPVADPRPAAGAHAVLLRLDPALPRTAAALDHAAGDRAAAGAAGNGLADARALAAVLAGRAAVL